MATEFDVTFKPTTSPTVQLRKNYDGLLQGYTGAISGQSTVPQLTQQYYDKFGVPQLTEAYQRGGEMMDNLSASILSMPKSVAGASQESILTQGQKDRVVNAQSAPLIEEYNKLGTTVGRIGERLTSAQQMAGSMISAEQIQQEKELAPWLRAFDNEQILGAMEMTGWTFENQSELTRLLSNQQAGITLSEGEKNRLNQLAIAEKGFQAQLDQIRERGEQERISKAALPDLGTLYKQMFG